ncbi:hypothetical protein IFM89_006809 [Coptis chinensis]|uniref:Uncharacterized protein n=1 Tax=Coptis chinensis TaxID=261450 RepID=A0A835M446_9MAGN|nr:hypothetical protein IFM89_006809 [Coptis chinensis]
MSNYKKHFLKHDENRFNEFLGKVERGEAKIAAGALFPHDIIKHLNNGENDGGRVVELQWKRMVDDLSEKGKLQNYIAVCDVSGSMSGEPMEVCVALGLLLSELSEHPWNGQHFLKHDENRFNEFLGKVERGEAKIAAGALFPHDIIKRLNNGRMMVVVLQSCSGRECMSGEPMEVCVALSLLLSELSEHPWNGQKVSDLLLQVAVAGNLDKDKMIEKVFVFSDIEFDNARRPYGGRGGNNFYVSDVGCNGS